MRYVYGPVPSRRLGFSLGVDVVPYKTCTLDCIYCQIGRTTQKSIERKLYTRKDNVLGEIRKGLNKKQRIDYITFSGSGEPTLNSDIGEVIKGVKALISIPVAVLTNGTLLFMEEVQKDLLNADVVLPSLDSASQRIFRSINRPHNTLKIEAIIAGLKQFRKIYNGQIWLEIMLIKGFNNTEQELSKIKKAVSEIRPDRVYLNTIIRPPSEIYAESPAPDEIRVIKDYLGGGCEVITEFRGKMTEEVHGIEESLIEMTKRRLVTVTDIANVFGISEANAEKFAEMLKAKRKFKEIKHGEKKYYSFYNTYGSKM
jgi:wyosine [tRNA(Phe)-imidazoG37] synthetase (radical SAM superfamily)